MGKYLVFQIYGPLQSWGNVAVGEIRPTSGRPTRSAVLGLLAACLGIRRHEEDRLQELAGAIGMTVRVDASGMRLIDYHTVQTPKEKRKRVFFSRRDELGPLLEPDEDLTTILSRREYLTDAHFTVCLWPKKQEGEISLEEIEKNLARPRLTPYLGRKCCPTALSFNPMLMKAEGPLEALREYPMDEAIKESIAQGEAAHFFSDPCEELKDQFKVMITRDEPLHHGRRQFTTRQEVMVSPSANMVE